MFNNVLIMGTMTDAIELRYTQSGTAIGNFNIAVNDSYKDKQGNKIEKAHFFSVSAFAGRAETINRFFGKGSRILIKGSLTQEKWQDKNDGSNKSKVSIKLDSFEFVDRKDDSKMGNSGGNQQPQQQGYNQGQPQQYQQQGQPPVHYEQVNQQGQTYQPQQQQQQRQMPQQPPVIDIDHEQIPF